MKKQHEYELQKQVCQWLSMKHPKVLFLSDTIASVKLTIPQSIRNSKIQKSDFKTPDLIILQPNKKYSGLFIELKTKSPFKKNSVELLKNEHIEAQQKTINDLVDRGYFACFSWEFERTVGIIDAYLKNII